MEKTKKTSQAERSPKFLSQRAKTLVTILGPDFARSSPHPFFSKLLELASQDRVESKVTNDDPELSRSLSALVRKLERAAPQNARPEPKPVLPSEKPEAKKPQFQNQSGMQPVDPLNTQHPAVIAQRVKSLSTNERAKLLRALPGRTSRQVLRLLRED